MAADNDDIPEDERTRIAPAKKPTAQPKTVILPKVADEVPAAPRPEVTAAPTEDDTGPILPGTMINNNYEIKELISAGGMGEVFRGENAFTGDLVAIKIVLNSLANDEKVAALFMREGPERFGASWNEMLRSFWIVLINMIISLYSLQFMAPTEPKLEGLSLPLITSLYSGKTIIAVILGLLLTYAFAKYMKKMEYIFQYITSMNWAGLISTTLALPPLISVAAGFHTWLEIYPVLIVFALYGYAISAFIITRIFRVPWQLGGFLAICGMAINDTLFNILFWIFR